VSGLIFFAVLVALTEDVLKSSEIEGEIVDKEPVRSSIARRLGMDIGALAHFWFSTIHPFGDGNGRIARAIADMALARSEQSPQRFYSMSAQIRLERNAYYDVLEVSQKSDLDITASLDGFERKMTSFTWAALTKSSPDTALHDIKDLISKGMLVREADSQDTAAIVRKRLGY
jgi:Fic family protein